jgi:hypothetical protein
MNDKKFKYQARLKQFSNCPSEDFKEIEKNVFRWVHQPISENDFLPMSVIKVPPPRILDDSDKLCIGYGLSMFDTKENAISKYKSLYERFRVRQKSQFREDKGNWVALISLTKKDGVADEPNNYGHFTFHEYETADLKQNVKRIFNIFDGDEKFTN